MTKKELFQWLSLCSLMTPQVYAQQLKIINAPIQERPSILNASPMGQERININLASAAELVKLPGIGEKRAQAIIDYRKRKKFDTIAQLIRVKGIGPKRMAQLKDKITVR